MPSLSTYPKQKIAITFPVPQIERAKIKAKREFGFNLPELVRYLIADYLKTPIPDAEMPTLKALERMNQEAKDFFKNEWEQKAIHQLKS